MFRSSDFGKDKPMKIFSIIALAAMGILAGCQTSSSCCGSCGDHDHAHGAMEASCCGKCGGDAAPGAVEACSSSCSDSCKSACDKMAAPAAAEPASCASECSSSCDKMKMAAPAAAEPASCASKAECGGCPFSKKD